MRRLPRALALVALVAVLVPLAAAGRAQLTGDARAQIRFHQAERMGIGYLRPLSVLLAGVAESRAGAAGAAGDLSGAVAAVEAADERYGTALGTSSRWGEWKDRFGRLGTGDAPVRDQYGELTRGLMSLVTQVANTSNLILDPDLDSYYLMAAIVVQQPILMDQIGAASELSAGGRVTAGNRDPLLVARSTIGSTVDSLAASLSTAAANTHDVRLVPRVAQPMANLTASSTRTLNILDDLLAGRAGRLDVSALLTALSAVTTASAVWLDALLVDRIAVLDDRVTTITQLVVLVLAVLALLAAGLRWAMQTIGRRSEELRHLALHDALTGLPNRALVLAKVQAALERARGNGTALAVFFLDLDDFKSVNDTYGHSVGDELLRAVSDRVADVLHENDTIGRLGGDELVVLAEGLSLTDGPEVIAERIEVALARPFNLAGLPHKELFTHASVGIAVGLRGAAADLLRDADVALYAAKAAGKHRYVLFDPQMQTEVQDRLELEADLRRAVDTDQLFLVYQPTVDLQTERITGAEALLRWRHPTRGLVMPDVFIPVAEDSGLIVPIGRTVLAKACRQAVEWQGRGLALTIAVNVSGRQLDSRSNLLADVQDALADSGLAPSALILELTETVLMRDAPWTTQRLRELKQLGLRLAIDDFGTGYCSLAYLQRFPVDTLKIDKSFVENIGRNAAADALIHIFVQLAKTFELETYAEGIADVEQLRYLQREGCGKGQGYLFAKPLSPAALEELVGNEMAGERRFGAGDDNVVPALGLPAAPAPTTTAGRHRSGLT